MASWCTARFYRDYMAEYLSLPLEKFHQIPLGIDLTGHDGRPGERSGEPFTIGYFARIARPKGLHRLVDAFVAFSQTAAGSAVANRRLPGSGGAIVLQGGEPGGARARRRIRLRRQSGNPCRESRVLQVA